MKIHFSYSSLDFEDFLFSLFFSLFFSFFSLRCNRVALAYASVAKEMRGSLFS